jgi:lysophospholipase L1-like esterase
MQSKQIRTVLVFMAVTAGIHCAPKKEIANNLKGSMKYDFGSSKTPGYIRINSSTVYNRESGFGFEAGALLTDVNRNSNNPITDGFVTSDRPFFFSANLTEGNYHVKIIVGDIDGTSDVSIRAECRRMMIERVITTEKEIKTVEFTVHVRDTLIRTSGNKLQSVHIKSRERNFLHWDDKLTLEFNGKQPKINAIEITPASKDVITVFLAGNSTVVDQDKEPYAAWGQMIPAFFEPGKISIANYAESGESLRSFIAAKRFEKVLSLMKPGDYAFIEFGHNDQKQTGQGIGAFTSYKQDLKYFIAEVKKKAGIPVLVTSMHRRSFDSSGKINQTLGDYPDAVRQTAHEENIALIDLNEMSRVLYEAWGPEESKKAFVIYPANTFPGQTKELTDNTHFNPYGAYEIARCIVNGIRQNNLGISTYLKKDLKSFDPSNPDAVNALYWPLTPSIASEKPDGN